MARLVLSAVEAFHLQPPAAVRLQTLDEEKKYYGHCTSDGRRHELAISRGHHDPLPLVTLAHELAHLRHDHGRKHGLLTFKILHHWQNEEGPAVRSAARALGAD